MMKLFGKKSLPSIISKMFADSDYQFTPTVDLMDPVLIFDTDIQSALRA